MRAGERFPTHEVRNQPPPLEAYDAHAADLPLRQALSAHGGDWVEAGLGDYGRLVGGELQELARLANENRPRFNPFDRYGHRLDEVEFHPAYHELMRLGIGHGVSGFAWRHEGRRGAHVARAGLMYLHYQADQGTSCPLTMTYACVPALRQAPALAADWLPRVLSGEYDPRHVPAWEKAGNTLGMGMTEKQGGSDVRSNDTRATALGDGLHELVGHKWFFSAPMSDAFLVLARSVEGLSCFLVPRFAPDGRRNGLRLQRLKDKLGDWSNASSEVELQGALGWMVGEPGRGVATILRMVALTRLDCALGSAALMRQALVQALHHVRHRHAFGRVLLEQPLMRSVLADLALESEAATALAFRLARAIDAAPCDPIEAAFARVATAIGKYWICKRAPGFANEAQECLGGGGYVEESTLPRLYRQAPLNSIWEGSGNVQCLDLLRALQREPACQDALRAEWQVLRGAHPMLDAQLQRVEAALRALPDEAGARGLAGDLALALQAACLFRHADPTVAEAWCAARLGGRGLAYGERSLGLPVQHLLRRAWPG